MPKPGAHVQNEQLREEAPKKRVEEKEKIIILKIGGSSITHKGEEETLNTESLNWFARLIASSVNESFLSSSGTYNNVDSSRSKPKFIVVHGAGSFGHHSAKPYGLRCGKAVYIDELGTTVTGTSQSDINPSKRQKIGHHDETINRQYQMEGLSKTRQSVQKLNTAVVNSLIANGVNAVGISPGMSTPLLRAHGGTSLPNDGDDDNDSVEGMKLLCQSIHQSLQAGLVPIVHGDACLLYDSIRAGILGGDTLAEGIATLWDESVGNRKNSRGDKISRVIFITDVAGVFSADPKADPNAVLVRSLKVDRNTGEVMIDKSNDNSDGNEGERSATLNVGESSHAHDVTGGLKVRRCSMYIARDIYVDEALTHKLVWYTKGKAGSSGDNRANGNLSNNNTVWLAKYREVRERRLNDSV